MELFRRALEAVVGPYVFSRYYTYWQKYRQVRRLFYCSLFYVEADGLCFGCVHFKLPDAWYQFMQQSSLVYIWSGWPHRMVRRRLLLIPFTTPLPNVHFLLT